MPSIKEILQKKNNPEGYWEDKLRMLVLEFENIKKEALEGMKKEIENLKQEMIADPMKKLSEREQMADFKTNIISYVFSDVVYLINDKIRSILREADEKIESSFEKINDEIDKAQISLQEIASLKNEKLKEDFDKFRSEIKIIKGERGERGEDGKNPDVGELIPLILEKIKTEKAILPSLEPKDVIKTINNSEEKISPVAIEGLIQELGELKIMIKERTRSSNNGGGMGNVIHEQFSGNGVLTSFTLKHNIAGNGNAVIACRYQGQVQYLGDQFTISGKTLTTTFTPDDGTKIEITYIRT